MVDKNAKDPSKAKAKYRCVFQGNNVHTQNHEIALFQNKGSSPVSMEGSRLVISYGLFGDHVVMAADATKAYIQAEFNLTETWVKLPEEAWPPEWFNKDGTPKYKNPVVRMLRPLYGHPDAGTLWEQYSFKKLQEIGFQKVPNWSSLFFHPQMKTMMSI